MGVINKKKIIERTIGEIILPNNSPNLIQILFAGVKNFEFRRPNTRKIKAIIKDHNLKSPPLNNGHIEIITKTIKKSIPKPLLLSFLFIKNPLCFLLYLLPNLSYC